MGQKWIVLVVCFVAHGAMGQDYSLWWERILGQGGSESFHLLCSEKKHCELRVRQSEIVERKTPVPRAEGRKMIQKFAKQAKVSAPFPPCSPEGSYPRIVWKVVTAEMQREGELCRQEAGRVLAPGSFQNTILSLEGALRRLASPQQSK